MKMIFFYIKEFEIGYVLIFSSVKISTYTYYKTNKTLSFTVYITVYMHILFHRRKKSFLIIEMKLGHCITLQKTLRKQYYSMSVVSNLFYMATQYSAI